MPPESIHVQCAKCHAKSSGPRHLAGQFQPCPRCGFAIKIPVPVDPVAALLPNPTAAASQTQSQAPIQPPNGPVVIHDPTGHSRNPESRIEAHIQRCYARNKSWTRLASSLFDLRLNGEAGWALMVIQLWLIVPLLALFASALDLRSRELMGLAALAALIGNFVVAALSYRRLLEHAHLVASGKPRRGETALHSLAWAMANGLLVVLPLLPSFAVIPALTSRWAAATDIDATALWSLIPLGLTLLPATFWVWSFSGMSLVATALHYQPQPGLAFRWLVRLFPQLLKLFGIVIACGLGLGTLTCLVLVILTMLLATTPIVLLIANFFVQCVMLCVQSHLAAAQSALFGLLIRNEAVTLGLAASPAARPRQPAKDPLQTYGPLGIGAAVHVVGLLGLLLFSPRPVPTPDQSSAAAAVEPAPAVGRSDQAISSVDRLLPLALPADRGRRAGPTLRLPTDFRFLPMTTARRAFDLATIKRGEEESDLRIGFSPVDRLGFTEICRRVGPDFVIGLHGVGLRVQHNRLQPGDEDYTEDDPWGDQLLWEPTSFACYRDKRRLGVWDHELGALRPANSGEADPICKDAYFDGPKIDIPSFSIPFTPPVVAPPVIRPTFDLPRITGVGTSRAEPDTPSRSERLYLNSLEKPNKSTFEISFPTNRLETTKQTEVPDKVWVPVVGPDVRDMTTWTGDAPFAMEPRELEFSVRFSRTRRDDKLLDPVPAHVTVQLFVGDASIYRSNVPVDEQAFQSSDTAVMLVRSPLSGARIERGAPMRLEFTQSGPGQLSVYGYGLSYIDLRDRSSSPANRSSWSPFTTDPDKSLPKSSSIKPLGYFIADELRTEQGERIRPKTNGAKFAVVIMLVPCDRLYAAPNDFKLINGSQSKPFPSAKHVLVIDPADFRIAFGDHSSARAITIASTDAPDWETTSLKFLNIDARSRTVMMNRLSAFAADETLIIAGAREFTPTQADKPLRCGYKTSPLVAVPKLNLEESRADLKL